MPRKALPHALPFMLEGEDVTHPGHLGEPQGPQGREHPIGGLRAGDLAVSLDDENPRVARDDRPLPLHQVHFGTFDVHNEVDALERGFGEQARERGRRYDNAPPRATDPAW